MQEGSSAGPASGASQSTAQLNDDSLKERKAAVHVEGRRGPPPQSQGPNESEKAFCAYYQQQLGLSSEDFAHFHAKLAEPLPVTFRMVGALRQGSTTQEADRFHSQLMAVRQQAEQASQEDGTEATPKAGGATEISQGVQSGTDGGSSNRGVRRLEWYPRSAAWQLEVPKREVWLFSGMPGCRNEC
eukprot:473618-Rhodomonas_salina.3